MCFYVCVYVVILEGCFKNEILFIEGYVVDGMLFIFDYDEVICLEIIVVGLVELCFVFDLVNGIVIVGIFLVFLDGVLVMLVMSE